MKQATSSLSSVGSVTGWQVYKRLLSYTKRYSVAFFIGVFGFMVYAQTQWIWAELIKYIVHSIEAQNHQARSLIAGAIAGIFFIRGIGSFVGNYCVAYVASHVVHTLRMEIFDQVLKLEVSYLQQQAQGRLLAKITYNVEQVASACADAFKVIIQESLIVLGLLGYLFYSHWKLALLFFLISPVIAWNVSYASRRLNLISRRIQKSMGDVAHVAAETLTGYQTVKVYRAEAYEQKRFNDLSLYNLIQSLKLVVTQSLNTPVVQFIVAMMLSLVVWLALEPRIFGDTTAGEFLAFITAAGMLAKPIRQLTQINTAVQKGIAGARSIFDLLDVPVERDQGREQLRDCKGYLSFRQVSFRYAGQDEQVLDQVSFDIKPGQTVALVGRSGAGKTTLINLVPRFYKPVAGEITVDHTPIETLSLESLRRNIGIVSQDIALFNDTLRHNIAYGKELQSCSEEKLWAAIEAANAKDFIEKLPQGLDTVVGENGFKLSGGQKQRIALARALLKNAPILLLDEATSALDQESEHLVQLALERFRKGRTTLVIAHRLSTIEAADMIVVLEKGCIIEQGTHQQLLAQGGVYTQLYRSGLAAS